MPILRARFRALDTLIQLVGSPQRIECGELLWTGLYEEFEGNQVRGTDG